MTGDGRPDLDLAIQAFRDEMKINRRAFLHNLSVKTDDLIPYNNSAYLNLVKIAKRLLFEKESI